MCTLLTLSNTMILLELSGGFLMKFVAREGLAWWHKSWEMARLPLNSTVFAKRLKVEETQESRWLKLQLRSVFGGNKTKKSCSSKKCGNVIISPGARQMTRWLLAEFTSHTIFQYYQTDFFLMFFYCFQTSLSLYRVHLPGGKSPQESSHDFKKWKFHELNCFE